MKYHIVIGNEPYLKDQYVKEHTTDNEVCKVDTFTDTQITLLRQFSIFGTNAVVINNTLSKDEEKAIKDMIEAKVEIPGSLFYVPSKVDKKKSIFKMKSNIIEVNKPSIEKVFKLLIDTCNENNVSYKAEYLQYLLDYSEYFEEDSISLYDLIGVIRSTSGNELTKEHIERSVQRSTKDNAFELIKLIPHKEQLIEYMNRLGSNPYQVIGALFYAFRLMAKLKISQNINMSDYQKRQYNNLAVRWTYDEIVSKLKALNTLRETHESKEVARALILATLLE